MSSKNIWTGPHEHGWANRREGGQRAISVHPTQREAIAVGRRLASDTGGELYIQRPNGQIRERDSHGHDPRKSKG